jgi:hypothetical protein
VERIKNLDTTILATTAIHRPEKEALNLELEQVVKRKADIDARSVRIHIATDTKIPPIYKLSFTLGADR